MFKAAVFKLTSWYLLLIMLLSIGFSFALYTVSTRELSANERQLEALLERNFFPGRRAPDGMKAFNQARLEQVIASRERIAWSLAYFNLLIFLGGFAASYFLARRTLQPIEENIEAQIRFTANASHELRTPLTVMKSEIEVALRDKKLTIAQTKELFASTLEEIERLEQLSSNLLKLANNTAQLEMAPCVVRDIITEATTLLTAAAEKKDIRLTVHVANESVHANHWSIVEVLTILLDNAIKYSPKSSVINITAERRPRSRQIAISVTDQGIGIAQVDLPHIFERFYQADKSRTKGSTHGYGLGLAIAQKIVELHHGSIEVVSQPKQGSTFTILLPAQRTAAGK